MILHGDTRYDPTHAFTLVISRYVLRKFAKTFGCLGREYLSRSISYHVTSRNGQQFIFLKLNPTPTGSSN